MNCDGVRGLLSAYVDGELSAGELLRVEQHLRRCHWCADEVDALRQTIALVATLPEVEVPAAFHAQLHNRLVALGPPLAAGRTAVAFRRNSQPNLKRWAMPAAAAAALVIGLSSYGSGLLAPRPAPSEAVGKVATNVEPTQPVTPTAGKTAEQSPGTNANQETDHGNVQEAGSSQNQPEDVITPSVQVDPPSNPETMPKPEFGSTTPPTGGTYVATPSVLIGIDDPGNLPPQQHLTASAEVASANAADLVEALKAKFANATVNQAGGTVQVTVTIPAAEFGQAVTFVQELTAAQAVLGSVELNTQLAETYQNLTQLEAEKKVQDEKLAKLTDQAELEVARKYLDELVQKAEGFRQEYKRLAEMASTGTLSVTLKPAQAE